MDTKTDETLAKALKPPFEIADVLDQAFEVAGVFPPSGFRQFHLGHGAMAVAAQEALHAEQAARLGVPRRATALYKKRAQLRPICNRTE